MPLPEEPLRIRLVGRVRKCYLEWVPTIVQSDISCHLNASGNIGKSTNY